MALMPESMRLNEQQEAGLKRLREKAMERHRKARIAARKAGRKDFPLLPYECSWAYEQVYRKVISGRLPDRCL